MNELELYNEIGKNIKKRRKSLGITQEKLADLTNYSLSFIANIESITYQSFSIAALNNIAKALNTNMASLLPKDNCYFKPVDNEIKCGNCHYQVSIPIELINLLNFLKDLSHQKIKVTCPKCNKKITI